MNNNRPRCSATLTGHNAMFDALTPQAVICLGKPFPEMKGNVVSIPFAAARKAVR